MPGRVFEVADHDEDIADCSDHSHGGRNGFGVEPV
jgi:hypothetical protein